MPNPYTISLLNDLHHFFPELLYRPERFQTVSDVLGYVVERAAESESYERIRQAYRGQEEESKAPEFESVGSSSSSASASASASSDESLTALLRLFSPRTPMFQRPLHRTRIAFPLSSSSEGSLASFLWGSGSGSGSGSGLESLFQAVAVRPTEEHLERNTHVDILEEPMDTNCAVCQDPMEAGQEIRTLLACCHHFHRTCVDRWFQEHVSCPTCRHDVREECE